MVSDKTRARRRAEPGYLPTDGLPIRDKPLICCSKAVEHRRDHRRRSRPRNGAHSDIAGVMDPGMHARIGDRSSKQAERQSEQGDVAAHPIGERERRCGMTGRERGGLRRPQVAGG